MDWSDLLCPECNSSWESVRPVQFNSTSMFVCPVCGFEAKTEAGFIDLIGGSRDATGDHYGLQWGTELGFRDFARHSLRAQAVMPASLLGWHRVIEKIRQRAQLEPVRVYDAACGFGGLAQQLIDEGGQQNIRYVGSDLHTSLADVARDLSCKLQHIFLRWDLMRPLPVKDKFDYVLCRAALHHTPDPPRGFATLCKMLKPGGLIAISVYNKKAVCREALDDALRHEISQMPPREGFEVCRQFAVLGKALQQISVPVYIPENLPILGIPAGTYPLQELIYYYFLKCFYNDTFGDTYSTLVNYDWYHPPFAYRYECQEVEKWFREQRIEILETQSIAVQHYLVGRREWA